MKPLILFTAMTVIGLFGIIGTVEYSHAETTIIKSIMYPHHNEHSIWKDYCFSDETHKPITNIEQNSDDTILFKYIYHDGDETVNSPAKIQVDYYDENNELRLEEQHSLFETYHKHKFPIGKISNPTNYRDYSSYYAWNLIYIPTYTESHNITKLIINIIKEANGNNLNNYEHLPCKDYKLTIKFNDSKYTELESKLDNQKEKKNKWKAKFNQCNDTRDTLRTELSNLQSNYNTYEGSYDTLESLYNESLDTIANQNKTITEHLFTIDKLKQEKVDLIKKVETLETQLGEN